MKFIDIHGHYAWDIDDGIQTKEETIEALEKARENNIVGIIATPHVICGRHSANDLLLIKQRLAEFKELAKQFKIQVFAGSEVFLNRDSTKAIHQGLVIPIENTSYLLAEFDVRKELGEESEVEDYLYEIEVKGYTPIVAHVERYFQGNIDLDRVENFVNNGYVIQVNASSILGIHGKTVKKNAYALIDEGLCHVIATDTHSASGRRSPCMQEVYEELSKKYDEDTLKTLMFDNPYHILKNEEIETIEVKKSFFKKLLKRR